jgi:FtsH ternary system-associated peptide
MALMFRDDEALRVVLMSGLCPPDVQSKGAHVARDGKGALIISPEAPLPKDALAKLRAAGVAIDAQLPSGARQVRTWAEAVALVRVAVTETPALVLIATPDRTALVDVSAELLRLGCERQELLVTPQGGLVRAIDPPTYTIVRAADREQGLRAYVPDPQGQDAVWCELGYRHPLAGRLKADPGQLLLVAGDGWRSVKDDGWRGLEAALELAVPGARVELAAKSIGDRRRVELRLSAGRREAPSLWVIRSGGVQAIDKLLEYLPEEIVMRLTFAAADKMIVIRARSGRHGPPDLSLDAEEYAPLSGMADVYGPAGAIVEPPLRRERLRQILEVDQGAVVWLAPMGAERTKGPFRVERIADNAFVPLSEWADYVIHASADALVPWQRAMVFDFAPFVSTGLEWSQTPGPPPDDKDKPDKKERRPRDRRPARGGVAVTPASTTQAAQTQQARGPRREGQGQAVEEVAIDAELAALEAEFVALDAPADAVERLQLLERLGTAYARQNRRRDAGLCFARAVWERTGQDANVCLDAWLAADLGRSDQARVLEQSLASGTPALDDVRRVAMIAARAPQAVARDPHRVVRWLDDHDNELDARTLWLARVGLARLAGGDTLGLAQTRDRILARLAGGLPVERELPSFLRFSGRSGALGNASGEHLGRALNELAEKIASTRPRRSPVEAPVANTNAYINFQLAHGFARIGQPERARALVAEGRNALATVIADPVHAYLVAAFVARVEQAIAGQPPETPLPDALGAQLANLVPGDPNATRVARYKVDRLREASRILEPLERPDAIGAFSKRQQDSRGPEFAALRGIQDPGARAQEVARLVGVAATAEEAEKARLLDGVFDVLLELPESGAAPILARAWPLITTLPEPRRAVLYAEALVVAGHFGRTELIPELLEVLSAALRVVPPAELQRALEASLRALRRIGLRSEIAELLADVEGALDASSTNLQARLAIASGLAFLGDTARALPILEQARRALDESMTLTARLDLTRALAAAYAQAPIGHALAGIADLAGQLREITDSFGTNSHYCLSRLHFVESLVLGITSDDLALGEAGRRFVEDDEHLIRRRLHRDLGGSA